MALPSGYTQLEYIETTGTQYIDTGFKPTSNTRVVMDCDLYASSSKHPTPFGARNSDGSCEFILSFRSGTTDCIVQYNSTTEFVLSNAYGRHLIDFDKNSLYYDGVLLKTVSASTFSCSFSMHIVGYSYGGTNPEINRGSMKIYSCQIYDNGSLVRDFVPCRNSSGTLGLYDNVNSRFYSNAGTGSFVAGKNSNRKSSYTQVEYIESTGAQYIDTGVYANANTKMEADLAYTTYEAGYSGTYSTGSSFMFGTNTNHKVYLGSRVNTSFGKADTNRFQISIDAKNKSATVAGVTQTYSTTMLTSPLSLLIFAYRGDTSITGYAKFKLYSYKLYNNNALAYDFIPCVTTSGLVGLYDKINNKFYGNAGTGSFVAGGITETIQGYTQVEYIESTQTQYINTGWYATQNTKIVIDAELTSKTADDNIPVLCGAYTNASNQFAIFYSTDRWVSWFGTGTSVIHADYTGRRLSSLESGLFSVSTDSIEVTTTSNFTTTLPIYVFALAQDNKAMYRCRAKLYSLQIYDDGALKRYFIPCTNSSKEAGLYDIITGEFYSNAGTGSFIAGNAIYLPTISLKENVGGVLKQYNALYENVDGVLKNILELYENVDGVLVPLR